MGWGVHDYPDPPDYTVPICPVCGEETDTLYADKDGEIFGCDNCVKTIESPFETEKDPLGATNAEQVKGEDADEPLPSENTTKI